LSGKLVLDCLNKQSDIALAEGASSQYSGTHMLRSIGTSSRFKEFEEVVLSFVDVFDRNRGFVEEVYA